MFKTISNRDMSKPLFIQINLISECLSPRPLFFYPQTSQGHLLLILARFGQSSLFLREYRMDGPKCVLRG